MAQGSTTKEETCDRSGGTEFLSRVAHRYIEAGKLNREAIARELEASKSRSSLAETLLKTLRTLQKPTEDLKSKSESKKFDKAYKDLGGLLDKCEKAKAKVLKLTEGVDPQTVADPEDFEASRYLVERYNLKLPALDHTKAEKDLVRLKTLRAEQTQGFIWEFEKFFQSLCTAATAAAKEAMKYEPKESKATKVEKLTKVIREKTGLGRGVSEQIADAIVRGREVERLAIQKNWPIEDRAIVGPNGALPLDDLT